jgi:hypothetical protein
MYICLGWRVLIVHTETEWLGLTWQIPFVIGIMPVGRDYDL